MPQNPAYTGLLTGFNGNKKVFQHDSKHDFPIPVQPEPEKEFEIPVPDMPEPEKNIKYSGSGNRNRKCDSSNPVSGS